MPNSLLAITLTSNFGTFILYALSCFLCIVAFHGRPDYSFLKHLLIPGFGLLANLVCMGFYVAGPLFNLGTLKEPLLALGISVRLGHLRSDLLPPLVKGEGEVGSALDEVDFRNRFRLALTQIKDAQQKGRNSANAEFRPFCFQ